MLGQCRPATRLRRIEKRQTEHAKGALRVTCKLAYLMDFDVVAAGGRVYGSDAWVGVKSFVNNARFVAP